MLVETIFGFIAFFTSVIGLLPQLIKSIKTHSTHDLSMTMLVNYLICSIAWIVYGSYTHSVFVLLSNIVGGCSSLILVLLKRQFDKK